MSKITITLNVDSIEEVYKLLKLPTNEITSQADNKLKDFKLAPRQNKTWTEFEINFLTDNYQKKNIRWIAGKLCRKPQGVYSMLNNMYKKGLKKKNNRVKTIN